MILSESIKPIGAAKANKRTNNICVFLLNADSCSIELIERDTGI